MAKDEHDLMSWLPLVAIFGGLTERSLTRIVEMLGVHRYEPGDFVCRQGESGRAMYLLRDGEVVVCRDSDQGRRLKLVRLHPGEFFGEMTLIDIQKRSASVLVEKPSLVYSLSNGDLLRLYREDVPGYVMVLQNICRELSRRLRVTNSRLQSLAEESDDGDATMIRPAVGRRPI
jgi:CRP/FNR family cyclic AMP-dependent transcriptional regulator